MVPWRGFALCAYKLHLPSTGRSVAICGELSLGQMPTLSIPLTTVEGVYTCRYQGPEWLSTSTNITQLVTGWAHLLCTVPWAVSTTLHVLSVRARITQKPHMATLPRVRFIPLTRVQAPLRSNSDDSSVYSQYLALGMAHDICLRIVCWRMEWVGLKYSSESRAYWAALMPRQVVPEQPG